MYSNCAVEQPNVQDELLLELAAVIPHLCPRELLHVKQPGFGADVVGGVLSP